MKLKNHNDALYDVNKSIELNESYVKAYLRRAEINMTLGEFDQALIDYHKIKDLDPSFYLLKKLYDIFNMLFIKN